MPHSKSIQSNKEMVKMSNTQNQPPTNYIWQRKVPKSTPMEPANLPKQKAPTVWRWISKQTGEQTSRQKFQWIPKSSTTSPMNSSRSVKKPTQSRQPSLTQSPRQKKNQWKWVPKEQVHRVDSYWAWVPKSLLHAKTETKPSQPHIPMPSYNEIRRTTTHWVPQQKSKPQQTWKVKSSLLPSSVTPIVPKKQQTRKWLPKNPQVSKPSQLSTKTTSNQMFTSGLKSMCFRALDLQLKLFGSSSVLLPRHTWYEFVHQQQGYSKLASNARQAKQLTLHD